MKRFVLAALAGLAMVSAAQAGENDTSPGAVKEDFRADQQSLQRIRDEKRKIKEREEGFGNDLDRDSETEDSGDKPEADAEDDVKQQA